MGTSLDHGKDAGLARRRRRRSAPPTVFSGTIFRLRPRVELMEDRTLLSTFLVNNAGDSGPGSLRQAILDSNAATGASNTIDFDIPGSGVQNIATLTPLPSITNPVLIDGTSQPSYRGTPRIELSGAQAGGDGLLITAPNVDIRGLDVGGFSSGAGIHITGIGATGDWIEGDFLGTDPTGTKAEPDEYGVEIDGGAASNRVGTNGNGVNDAGERNVISGNVFAGVWITGQGTDGNAVAGNFIGTDATGKVALGNGPSPDFASTAVTLGGGIVIQGGASGNWIGTDGRSVDDVGERNVIAGNKNDGVEIDGTGTDDNIVAGNFIGTDLTGANSLGTSFHRVFILGGSATNWIGVNPEGGTALGDEGNVISGNGGMGVQILSSSNDVVAGDRIGTDVSGTIAVGDQQGIVIESSSGITIGGTVAAATDVISGNNASGIEIEDSSDNLVEGDLIGIDATGTKVLDNNGSGVVLEGESAGNTIGGTATGARDVISGNKGPGVEIDSSSDNLVEGDLIGTDATGMIALGNTKSGVILDIANGDSVSDASEGNTIGGTVAGAGDVISGNKGSGVEIDGSSDNLVEGNDIGTDATGTIAMGNALAGVNITADLDNVPFVWFGNNVFAPGVANFVSSIDNTIGGTSAFAGNLITDNGGPGVAVTVYSSVGDQITANRIHGNTGQAIDLGDDGVTQNATVLRTGPDELQNYPILFTTSDGQTEGWLGVSEPDTTYRIDVYASAGYGPGGAGEAQDYLGSLQATTDASGVVTFAIPFAAPAGLPILTATATDRQGNTSEVSALRQGVLDTPDQAFRLAPDEPLSFSAATGDGIILQDPEAGTLDLPWDLTLSVAAGTLTLSTVAGLSGTGDGTGSLTYSGPLSAIDGALAGLSYTPPSDFAGAPTLSLEAQSVGATPIQAQIPIVVTDGRFTVTTTADSGPGSLRQAIMDSDLAVGGTNRIEFDIPGTGVHTIVAASPLPAITTPLVIDGTSQPGYGGTPLIAIVGQSTADADPMTLASDLTVKGVSIGGSAFSSVDATTMLAVESMPIYPGEGLVTYRIVVSADEDLVATAQAVVTTTSLSLLDAQGHTVVQSDGLSAAERIDAINIDLAPGTYSLVVHDDGAAGSFALTAMMTPSATAFQPVPVGNEPDGVVAGDFTGDGTLDLAVANSKSNTVSILIGNGDGTFQSAVNYSVGNDPVALVAGDFNGDGKVDLAVVNGGAYGTVSILLGHGDGTFQRPASYTVGDSPDAIAAGDFSGDGKLDLAIANADSNNVSILMGNGDGMFRTAVNYSVGYDPTEIVAADFTGDGRIDLAVTVLTGLFSGGVSVLLGDGDGTFRSAGINSGVGNAVAIVAGDFTGDGRIDLAVADSSGFVEILLGNGDGTFESAVDSPYLGINPSGLAVGDFNGDGHLNLAVALGDNTVLMMLVDGDGTVQYGDDFPVGNDPDAMVTGDFNGDGKLDLAVANDADDTVSILIGNGDQSFRPAVGRPIGIDDPGENGPSAIVAGDFTGDGRLDLAIANYNSGTVSILLGNGDGTFRAPVNYTVGVAPDAIVAQDFNGDGRLDLAVTNQSDNTVSILLGNGDGTFQPALTYSTGEYTTPTAIVAGDFNGDGHLDLAVADAGIQEEISGPPGDGGTLQFIDVVGGVSILLGYGDGTFQPAIYDPIEPAWMLVAGDFNGDGKLDLAIGNPISDNVAILIGKGNGTFQPPIYEPAGSEPGASGNNLVAMVAGDFSGNGRVDLAALDSSGTVSILMGNGDGTFVPGPYYIVNSGYDVDNAMITGDFNGDGKLDLAVGTVMGSYSDSSDISILLGNGDGTFQPAIDNAFESGAASFAPNVYYEPDAMVAGDFDGDGKLDLAFIAIDSGIDVGLGHGDGTLSLVGQPTTNPQANPVVADVNGDGTDDVLVVNGEGDILYRQGIPGQPGTFEPPVTVNTGFPSRDIAWVPDTLDGPLLVSVDADDDEVSLFAWRDGAFVRVGSLATGALPAQVIAAGLTDDGWNDLIVRNAGDGTLSIFRNNQLGSFLTGFDRPFLPATTLSVGLGLSDVQTIDTSGDGALDLVVSNELTGQVSILHNWGDGTFAAPVPYRTGIEISAIDPGDEPEMTNPDGTLGLAAGTFTRGGPTSLVTINPGSTTIGILDGLGSGRFADAAAIETPVAGEIVRTGDFTGNGLDDLAVLTADGVSIYLASDNGGFLPPTTYPVPSEADGLTIADPMGNGKLDLLVGDAYGDVLVLLGKSDGTFSPYREADQAVELAVTDLTGDGQKDIIYADQGLDRVVVDYGAGNSAVLANQTTGLLNPGAVALADLNGDGIPDLIVADSGSNNVLIYPGLGNGQFGPGINGGNGYFVGTDPVGITVADLTNHKDGVVVPDLVIADRGSNDVAVLDNKSEGGEILFAPAVRFAAGAGPVSTVIQPVAGGYPNLLVSDSASDSVTILPGRSPGDFDPGAAMVVPVGEDPGPIFLGDFGGTTEVVTVNAGSNDLTVISDFNGPDPLTSTISSGGVDPDTAFAFDPGGGFEDLVVGNGGDGDLALFEGGDGGLSLMSVENEPDLPSPTALAFSTLTGGEVQFYAATAGRESAELVSLSLGLETSPAIGPSALSSSPSPSTVVQLVSLHDTSLPLVATVLTLTIEVSGEGEGFALAESQALSVSASTPGSGISVGQGSVSQRGGGGSATDGSTPTEEAGAGAPAALPPVLAPWERFLLGLDEALEEFRRANPEGLSGAGGVPAASDGSSSQPAPGAVPQGGSTSVRPTSDGLPFGEEPAPSTRTSATTGSAATAAVISIIPAEASGRRMSPRGPSGRVEWEGPGHRMEIGPPTAPIDARASANWLVLDAAIDEHAWQKVSPPIEQGPPSFSKPSDHGSRMASAAMVVAAILHGVVDRPYLARRPSFPGRSGVRSPSRRLKVLNSS